MKHAILGDCPVDLMAREEFLSHLQKFPTEAQPLAVVSANLDHLHHFRGDRSWEELTRDSGLQWQILLDGAPLVRRSRTLTGMSWPRLAGADLLRPVLTIASQRSWSVGFLGGTPKMQTDLQTLLAHDLPDLRIAGVWGPRRAELLRRRRSMSLAEQIRFRRTDVLVVGLGKPFQEEWIADYGLETGAKVLLAFGAAADFLAGRRQRAPEWMQELGAEWLFRLALEPQRMSKRYLVQGPPAWIRLRTRSIVPQESPQRTSPQTVSGAIIVPAHNESAVIGRTLDSIRAAAETGQVEAVVVANGCTDDTADIARAFGWAQVVELPVASKGAALNAGDRAASRWPRLYLDADVTITPRAVDAVFSALASGNALAARPPFIYDTAGASEVVRAFYRARSRLAETRGHLWGAGAYALSKDARSRFDDFPPVIADDLFIDSLFKPGEVSIIDTDPVVVRTPKTFDSLLSVLRRTYRGNGELATTPEVTTLPERTTGQIARQLLASTVRSPLAGLDAAVYGGSVAYARASSRESGPRWNRDLTSRNGGTFL